LTFHFFTSFYLGIYVIAPLLGAKPFLTILSMFFLLAQVFFFLKRKSVPEKRKTGKIFCFLFSFHPLFYGSLK